MKTLKNSASHDLSKEGTGGCAPVKQGSTSRKQRQRIQEIDLTHTKGSKFAEVIKGGPRTIAIH